jgi:Patatin-like phospholipase
VVARSAPQLGAARRLYKDRDFAPDLIAGVSIGAITAVLLARPARGLKPLEALEAFWQKITVSGFFLPPPLRPYASALGNPNFFVPRFDYYALPMWDEYLRHGAATRDIVAIRRSQGTRGPGGHAGVLGQRDRRRGWRDRVFLQPG